MGPPLRERRFDVIGREPHTLWIQQAIVAFLPRRPAKRRRWRSRHAKVYVAVHNGTRCVH